MTMPQCSKMSVTRQRETHEEPVLGRNRLVWTTEVHPQCESAAYSWLYASRLVEKGAHATLRSHARAG